eukprot:3109196-Rhodomonas_salina.4
MSGRVCMLAFPSKWSTSRVDLIGDQDSFDDVVSAQPLAHPTVPRLEIHKLCSKIWSQSHLAPDGRVAFLFENLACSDQCDERRKKPPQHSYQMLHQYRSSHSMRACTQQSVPGLDSSTVLYGDTCSNQHERAHATWSETSGSGEALQRIAQHRGEVPGYATSTCARCSEEGAPARGRPASSRPRTQTLPAQPGQNQKEQVKNTFSRHDAMELTPSVATGWHRADLLMAFLLQRFFYKPVDSKPLSVPDVPEQLRENDMGDATSIQPPCILVAPCTPSVSDIAYRAKWHDAVYQVTACCYPSKPTPLSTKCPG